MGRHMGKDEGDDIVSGRLRLIILVTLLEVVDGYAFLLCKIERFEVRISLISNASTDQPFFAA